MKLFLSTTATMIALALPSVAHAEGMKPGLWEFTTQMSGAGMPAMPSIPEAQRKQMEAMGMKMPQGGGIGVTTKVCVTPEQAKKGVPPETGNREGKCEQTDIKTSGKTTTWKMVCTGKHRATGRGSVTYDNAEHFSGETTMDVEEGPRGPMTMNNKFSGSFVALNCKQGK